MSESTTASIATPSPCINVCKMNTQTGYCEGCWRSLDEIAVWSTASESIKQLIWQKIHLRIRQRDQDDLSLFGSD